MGQRHEITIRKFFCHLLHHALKRFVIKFAINFFNKNNLFKSRDVKLVINKGKFRSFRWGAQTEN